MQVIIAQNTLNSRRKALGTGVVVEFKLLFLLLKLVAGAGFEPTTFGL
jgi:hypothetical protein